MSDQPDFTLTPLSDGERSQRAIDFMNRTLAPKGEFTSSHAQARAEGGATYYWKHLAVNFVNGTQLWVGGGPLHVSKVRVYATDIQWQFATSADSVVTTPDGNGQAAPGGWRFPGAPAFGIVLYQANGIQYAIKGTSPATAQEFTISNLYDIYFNVNDGSTSQTGYADNSGAYSIVLEVLQP